MEKRSIKNLFCNPAWCIACRKINPQYGLIPDLSQEPFSVLLPTNTDWYADPMCFEDCGRVYIFVELTNYREPKSANIGFTEFKDGSFTPVKEIIREPFHMSYPNVFKYKEHYYMIPETSAANQVRLYESEQFPDQWKLKKVLLDGVKLVDSSFMRISDDKLLFFSHDIKDDAFKLRMFVLDLNELSFTEIEKFDGASDERPGGNVLTFDGKKIRVIQDCSTDYGMRIKLYQIETFDFESRQYEEKYIGEITIDNTPLNIRKRFQKLHTFTRSERYEVVDMLYSKFYPSLPIRRIRKMY